MKKLPIYLLVISLITQNIHAEIQEKQDIILTSPIVDFIDGNSLGITGHKIKLMLQVHREIKKIQLGDRDKDGHFHGHYLFDGTSYSVRQLMALESKYETMYEQKMADIVHDNHYQQNLKEVEIWHTLIKSKFHVTLVHAKKDFEEKVASFAKDSHGAKGQMLMLIDESCKKRGRTDSLLVTWADTKEGAEMQFFNEQIISFKGLDQFCTDLTNFLGDLMRSCPRAMAQFKKLKKEWDEKHPHKA